MIGDVTPLSSRATSAIAALLDRERLLTLACNRPDGWPQATTVGYVNEGLTLYFVVARTSQKFDNLRADPRASVAIRFSGKENGDGVGLSMAGKVEEVTEPAVVERLNKAVAKRFPGIHVHCPSGPSVVVLRFRPTIISAVGVVKGRSDPQTFVIEERTVRPVEGGKAA